MNLEWREATGPSRKMQLPALAQEWRPRSWRPRTIQSGGQRQPPSTEGKKPSSRCPPGVLWPLAGIGSSWDSPKSNVELRMNRTGAAISAVFWGPDNQVVAGLLSRTAEGTVLFKIAVDRNGRLIRVPISETFFARLAPRSEERATGRSGSQKGSCGSLLASSDASGPACGRRRFDGL